MTSHKLPTETIITQEESAISHLPPTEAEETRQDIASTLRRAKLSPSNISRSERICLRNLHNNSDIIVLPADKGDATVILNTSDYVEKMSSLLKSSEYKTTPQDPTTYLVKKTKALITASKLPIEIRKSLIPREKYSRIPRIYGLPKVHKPDIPLRPIVSAFGSPTHHLAKYLASTLQPLAEESSSHVMNSFHFIETLRTYQIHESDILVSFDVVSLSTNIPLKESLEILKTKHHIPQDTLTLINHCMSNTYFLFQGTFYKQVKGAPKGSPLSPAIADIYMENFETNAIDSFHLKPTCWLRYVDDVFVIWPHGPETLQDFFDHLNNINIHIKFTMEDTIDNESQGVYEIPCSACPRNASANSQYAKEIQHLPYSNTTLKQDITLILRDVRPSLQREPSHVG
ncbi:uncharacterized protein LOC123673342 [Harmonia axyridis]|uniref:uncharacterized protein LOC123673342 n=1 Tax=Harmonia axyridis TaxID=115357 RepID=UPI001E276C21|nr:uncharacterized protein LOC123673342 [Harmonia axyridis]